MAELALPPLARELGIGLLIGAGLYTACVLILMVMGIYRVEGLNPSSFMLPAVAMALSSGFLEELLFRGVLFRIVEEWMGSWVALVVSSLVFGLVHLINPAATWTGALFISVEAGVLLAAAYMLTRRLWLGIGFHIAWNYTQSAVFSGIVSGSDSAPGLIRSTIDGPAAADRRRVRPRSVAGRLPAVHDHGRDPGGDGGPPREHRAAVVEAQARSRPMGAVRPAGVRQAGSRIAAPPCAARNHRVPPALSAAAGSRPGGTTCAKG